MKARPGFGGGSRGAAGGAGRGEPPVHPFDTIVILVTLTALFAYLNYRLLGLPQRSG